MRPTGLLQVAESQWVGGRQSQPTNRLPLTPPLPWPLNGINQGDLKTLVPGHSTRDSGGMGLGYALGSGILRNFWIILTCSQDEEPASEMSLKPKASVHFGAGRGVWKRASGFHGDWRARFLGHTWSAGLPFRGQFSQVVGVVRNCLPRQEVWV